MTVVAPLESVLRRLSPQVSIPSRESCYPKMNRTLRVLAACTTAAFLALAGASEAQAADPERTATEFYYYSKTKRLKLSATVKYKSSDRSLMKFVTLDTRTQVRGTDNVWRTKRLCTSQRLQNSVSVNRSQRFLERSPVGGSKLVSSRADLAGLLWVDRDLSLYSALGGFRPPTTGCSFSSKTARLDDNEFPRLA